MDHMPEIDDIIQRQISKAYISGNMITSFDDGYFTKWYSLKFIDVSGNPNLHCYETTKIPAHVKIQMECVKGTEGEYSLYIYIYI